MNNDKTNTITGRRTFLQTSAGVLALSGILPACLSKLIPYSESAGTAIIHADNDDLQKIKQLLSDKTTALKWLFTGDSITQGAKHTLGYRCYSEIFSERVRFEMGRPRDLVINSAISGHTAQNILDDFDWRVAQFKPAIVSIMIGTNDAATIRKVSIDDFDKNIMNLVLRSRNIGAIPILHTPTIISKDGQKERERLPLYAEVVRKVAKEKGTILVDHWDYWEASQDKVFNEGWLNDPLHPNGKGHLEIARLLFKTLGICPEPSFTCSTEIKFS